MNGNDKALMKTSQWTKLSGYRLEDLVSVADAKSVALQGVVAFVGPVHFAEGIWVGIQLTGPSVGKGHNDGSVNGKRYFPHVGKKNGVFAPIEEVQKRIKAKTGDPVLDAQQEQRKTLRAQMADVNFVESLKEERSVAILKRNEEKRRFLNFENEQIYVQRLKQQRLDELRRSRNEPLQPPMVVKGPKPKFGGTKPLEKHDFEFVRSLEMTQQNFCLTDPSLPDNPVIFASQAFLNMTGYCLSEILGRNCRFLQGPRTDPRAVNRIRMAIEEGSDCSVCLLNYRANGSTFYNHCFVTALRDERGRIKNYIGVQCEVSTQFAADFNRREFRRAKAQSDTARLRNTNQGAPPSRRHQEGGAFHAVAPSSGHRRNDRQTSTSKQSERDHFTPPNDPAYSDGSETVPLTPENDNGAETPIISNYNNNTMQALESAFTRATYQRDGNHFPPPTPPQHRRPPVSVPKPRYNDYPQHSVQELEAAFARAANIGGVPTPQAPRSQRHSQHHRQIPPPPPLPPMYSEDDTEEPEIVPVTNFVPVRLEARSWADPVSGTSMTQLEVGEAPPTPQSQAGSGVNSTGTTKSKKKKRY